MFSEETKARLDAAVGPPTDLEKFGKSLGVVAVEPKEMRLDGMVLPKGSGYKVILNPSKGRERYRFSWAHELGHILVQSGSLARPQFRSAQLSHRELEQKCDEIAAEILMPEERFREYIEKQGTDLSAVPKLARAFDTSILSTAIRLRDFLPFPAVLSRWTIVSGKLTHKEVKGNALCRPYSYGLPKGNKSKGMSEDGPQKAFESSDIVRTKEPLMRTEGARGRESVKWMTFPTESKAFGYGGNRYVLSFHYIEQLDN